MRTAFNKISDPIHEMMKNDEVGRVIFEVTDFKQSFNTRTAALGNRSRHRYDIYTQGKGEHEIHVIKRGGEHLPGIRIDLRPYKEADQ